MSKTTKELILDEIEGYLIDLGLTKDSVDRLMARIRDELKQEGDRFTEIMSLTHTCYNGVRGGCGRCSACLLRDRGFHESGVDDPVWQYRQVSV